MLIGLLTGLLLFGSGGFAAGRLAAGRPPSPAVTATASSSSPALRPYEQSQLALNQQKFRGDLAALARSWLPWLSSCATDAEPGGPKLNSGEAARVSCSYGASTVYFVQYTSAAERDKARTGRLAQNIDARWLAPGVAEPTQRNTTSGTGSGNYVEYAFKITEGDRGGRVVAGLWWDDRTTPVAGYLLAYWSEGLGGSWLPLRDLWQRTS